MTDLHNIHPSIHLTQTRTGVRIIVNTQKHDVDKPEASTSVSLGIDALHMRRFNTILWLEKNVKESVDYTLSESERSFCPRLSEIASSQFCTVQNFKPSSARTLER